NYSLIESGTSNAIINWTTSYANNEWVVVTKPNPGWNLVNGNSYFFRVKARNIVGLISDVKESDGITVDTSLKPSNCTNKAKDEKETDVDCGGVCSLCNLGKKCNINADCKSSFCNINGVCTTPKCDDNTRNQEETDVDCGGSCKKCQNDKTCVNNNDCESGYCGYGSCKPQESCLDGKLSGIESDVDCGGACPTKCPEEKNCGTSEDCAEGLKCVLSVCKRCAENDENCNGIPDEQEETKTEIKDTDNDGMPDEWEIKNGLNPNDPNDAEQDSDKEGLANLEEYKSNTNPNLEDTDGDGFTDKQEVDAGTNPLDPKDFPKSSLTKIIWFILGIVILLSGFGYLTYRLMEKKREEKFEIRSREIQRAISPQQVKQVSSKQVEEKAKIKEALKKKEEEKEKERKKLFEAFGKEEKSKEELKETKIEKPEHKSEKKPSDIRKTRFKKPKEDVFIKLKEIAKETKKKRK
ncbi:hypothetical protein HYX00_05460, partial [Candidatus Woesearchaeota archaeon]|nr:hypothetical protein [Candidatus Woesearchaeota archaeon]